MKHNIRDAKICKVLFSRKYKCLMKSMILMVLKENEKNFIVDSFMSTLPHGEYFWKFICCALEIYFEA